MLLGCGPQVVGRSDCPQPARRGDGLQTGNARADDQYSSRSDRPRSGRKHGENSGQRIRGDQDRFVSANRAHGREGVHALRACAARYQFHGERGHAFPGNLLQRPQRAKRPKKADECVAAMEQRHVRLAGAVVRTVAQHLNQDVSGSEEIVLLKKSGSVEHPLTRKSMEPRPLFSVAEKGSGFRVQGSAPISEEDADPRESRVFDTWMDSSISATALRLSCFRAVSTTCATGSGNIGLGDAMGSLWLSASTGRK